MSSPRNGIQFRYESKFSITELDRPEVESIVRINPMRFSQAFPRRWVNNIYLDTWRFGSYEEKLSGSSEDRAKVRIRWYGELFGPVETPLLELKIRRGLLNRKESFPLAPFAMGAGFSLRTVRDLFRRANLPEALRQQLLKLQLVLVNRYSRSYLISANRAFRLTIDSDLCFHRLAATGNGFQTRWVEAPAVVIELKYPQERSRDAQCVTQHFPFRLARCSKYVMGVERVRGY